MAEDGNLGRIIVEQVMLLIFMYVIYYLSKDE